MKCRQYNVKVFEIGLDDLTSFKDFIDANLVLIKNHLLSLKGSLDESTKQFLDERGLKYVCNMELPAPQRGVSEFCLVNGTKESDEENKVVSKVEDEPEVFRMDPLKIVKGSLRSGQCIEHNGDVLATDRINSGAKIAAMGSVIALGKVEGDISSAGECIITTPTKKGNILFHGTRIEGEKLVFPLNLIKFDGNDIVIQPISKKEFI